MGKEDAVLLAILKKEVGSYFASAVIYVYLCIFYAISGAYFFLSSLLRNTADLSGIFLNLFSVVIFFIPLLTMRLISEERKHKTDQILLTVPTPLFSIVLGKYLAAVCLFLIGISMTLVYGVVLSAFGSVDWAVLFGNFLGLFAMGCALIAVGLFVSSLTENQMVAALGGFAVGLLLLLTDSLAQVISVPLLRTILSGLSFLKRYYPFTLGILELPSVVYFISVSAVFLFLTVCTLEKRRWS